MKTADKMLLHSVDATTPGGLHNRRFAAFVHGVAMISAIFAAFVLGYVLGSQ